MIVLALFDGMACGLEALKRAGIPVTKYYASEIDKYAIQIAKKNHPEIIHIGDVNKWREWDIEKPDLIIGGSPCQGFSFAGKQLAFDDPRSKLFFVMMDIINHHKPTYRLLENVKMKKECLDVISMYMQVPPMFINSSLVSAQNRERYYWFNWEAPMPKDKGIFLKDIILPDAEPVVLHNLYGGFKEKQIRVFENKSPTIRTAAGGGHIPSVANSEYIREKSKTLRVGGRTIPPLSKQEWDNIYKADAYNKVAWRKLTPIECERLQTLPDNYTQQVGVSDTQRYKMLGNGWTVDVISHIFQHMKEVNLL